jgi:hypothetical protein
MRSSKGNRRIPPAALIEGDFLESKLPVRAFATLITLRQSSPNWFDGAFQEWVQGIQAHSGRTLGWIKSLEPVPQLHAHAALIANSLVDCDHAQTIWRSIVPHRYEKAGIVEPFLPGICGMGYIAKQLRSSFEDVHFSHNLSAFAHGSGTRFFGRTSDERRQLRRIAEQFEL